MFTNNLYGFIYNIKCNHKKGRAMLDKLLQKITGILLFTILLTPSISWGEATAVAIPGSAKVDGFSMMNWFSSLGIVEQLQTIHRLGQSSSSYAISGLISALDSPFPLARRKASHSLVEKIRLASVEEKKEVAKKLSPTIENSDPIVQKDIVKLVANMNIPESRVLLQSFFQKSTKEEQLTAIEALSQTSHSYPDVLAIVIQSSPYGEVKRAASGKLK